MSNLEEQSDNVKITGEIRIADYAFKIAKVEVMMNCGRDYS